MSAVADESSTSSAEERVKAAMAAEEAMNKKESPVDTSNFENFDLGGRPFPLSMIVGQDNIKQSLNRKYLIK